ncbi:hypothetical protein BD311DRAFT_812169 [Dichomitus squalens]|uniref:Uncharacterized protein n=1 Tax=Dichomitus squalens TaxID=114155 RepID=A0A4Q9M7H4_9APHY|nr:hypothetical protein BD311DRAFT_812169 [Dichomitus squalens]
MWEVGDTTAGLGREAVSVKLSPFMHVGHESLSGEDALQPKAWRRRLNVAIEVFPETFIGTVVPLSKGHEPGFARESFQATMHVKAEKQRWPWPWSQWGRH